MLLDAQVAAIRDFNRYYTARLGLLRKRHLDGAFSLTEARILYEVAARPGLNASALRSTLSLDRGYLSRTLAALTRRRLLRQQTSSGDAREKRLTLTALGEQAAADLDRQAAAQMQALLKTLAPADRAAVANALATVRRLLGNHPSPGTGHDATSGRDAAPPSAQATARTTATLPTLRIRRLNRETSAARALLHEYYEAVHVVARDPPGAIQRILDDPDAGMWLAFLGRRAVGCVVLRPLTLQQQPMQHAKPPRPGGATPGAGTLGECKRLYVQPSARGHGIAAALLDALEAHARRRGMQWIYLDSYDDLKPAIALYRKRGYRRCPRYNDNPQATLFLRKPLA